MIFTRECWMASTNPLCEFGEEKKPALDIRRSPKGRQLKHNKRPVCLALWVNFVETHIFVINGHVTLSDQIFRRRALLPNRKPVPENCA